MKYYRRRRSIWFWVGVILISISALFWLVVIAVAVDEFQDAGYMILAGLFFSVIPVGVGIYSVNRGKRRYKRKMLYC